MEDVMQKVKELYDTLQAKSSELKAKSQTLNDRVLSLDGAEKDLAQQQNQLAEDKRAVSIVKNVLEEQQDIAVKSAELKLAVAEFATKKPYRNTSTLASTA